MNRTQLLLFASTVFIWGSTWYAIKFQLGVVDPLVSVAWRFFAASALIFLVCRLIGVSSRLTGVQHRWAVLQGVSLFGLNYCLFYIATGYLTTGLIAVSFSTMVIWNILGAGLWFKSQVPMRVVVGACVGFCGVVLLFMPDVFDLTYGPAEIGAIFLCFLATLCASFGNLVNARNQKAGIGLWQGNAWGMLYGAIATLGMAIGLGKPLAFDFSWPYVTSLAYLVVFGSVAAFGAYLALLHRAGPEKAAFASLLFPVVALTISTVFEDYQWSVEAVLGVALILGGNRLALKT